MKYLNRTSLVLDKRKGWSPMRPMRPALDFRGPIGPVSAGGPSGIRLMPSEPLLQPAEPDPIETTEAPGVPILHPLGAKGGHDA